MNEIEKKITNRCIEMTTELLSMSNEITIKQITLMKEFLSVYEDNPSLFKELTKNEVLKQTLKRLSYNFAHSHKGAEYILEECE